MTTLIILGVIAILLLLTLFKSFFMVEQQTVAIVARFGKFIRSGNAGYKCQDPICRFHRRTY